MWVYFLVFFWSLSVYALDELIGGDTHLEKLHLMWCTFISVLLIQVIKGLDEIAKILRSRK